jgi:hypothetical protein
VKCSPRGFPGVTLSRHRRRWGFAVHSLDYRHESQYEIYGMSEGISLRLDVGCPDHLAPLLGLVGDQLAEVGG